METPTPLPQPDPTTPREDARAEGMTDATTSMEQVPPGPSPSGLRRRWLRRGGIAAITLAGAVSLVGTGVAADRVLLGATAPATDVEDAELALIREAWDEIHDKYVRAGDLDDRKLAYGAIGGMADAVGDTGHTSFETPEERAAGTAALADDYVGIGIAIEPGEQGPVVRGVFRDSPAEAADVRKGDRLTMVDGQTTGGLDLSDVVALVRGEEGTTVAITIERDGAQDPIDLTLTRERIDTPVVSWAPIPGTELAMVRLDRFATGATDELREALMAIEKTEATGIVLDLRGNGGGYVNEAVNATSLFLSDGVVHLSRDAKGSETPTPVQGGAVSTSIPIAVLVDGETASSAEILTGALQDQDRATVVGQRTFGTGTVLSEVPLSDGSALRIGVIEWLTPDGREIWHKGIDPDHAVELPPDVRPVDPDDLADLGADALRKSGDAQLLRAIELLGA
jgi:carboxyl-terminal processing protease